MTEHDDDFVPDLDGIPSARDSTLAWDRELLVVRAVDPERAVRDEGPQRYAVPEEYDREIPLSAIIALRAKRPWPALEIEWQLPDTDAVHRLVVHPRGVHRPVPRAREVLASYERFGELVEALFDHVAGRVGAASELDQVRGWLDDRVVPFEPMPALPGVKGRAGPYRGSGETESLLVRTLLPAALVPRVRHRVSRLLARTSGHDGLSALALSERFVWVVKESGAVLRIARDEMRGLFSSGERFDLVFGRSTFLSVALPAQAPIRAALVDAAHEAAARLHASKRIG